MVSALERIELMQTELVTPEIYSCCCCCLHRWARKT